MVENPYTRMGKGTLGHARLLGAIVGVFLNTMSLDPALGQNLDKSLGQTQCDIYQDEQMISHARAADEIQAIACLGYLHGRDRSWQMDYFRKTVQGVKAEYLGYKHIESDFLFRMLGLEERAEKL